MAKVIDLFTKQPSSATVRTPAELAAYAGARSSKLTPGHGLGADVALALKRYGTESFTNLVVPLATGKLQAKPPSA